MPRLPGVADLGPTARAEPARPIADYEAGGQAVAKATQQLGAGVAKLGEGVADFALDKGRWEYAQAHADQLSNKIDEYNNLRDDRDYATMGERYGKRITEINTKAANLISNPAMRERFLTDTRSDVAQFNLNVAAHARKLNQDDNVGYVQEQGDNFIRKAVDAPDEATRAQIIDTHNQLVDGLVEDGSRTPVQAAAMKKQWATKYVGNEIASLIEKDPQEAIKRLSEEPKKNSPYSILLPGDRARMLNQARSAAVGSQYEIKKGIEDDVTATLDTGKGMPGMTPERIRSAFGPRGDKAVIEWQDAKADAFKIWQGSHDFPQLTDADMYDRVESYRPKDGVPGYTRQQTIHDALVKKADAVTKLRREDPAEAVSGDPKVGAATAKARTDPQAMRELGEARMQAQGRLGIADDSQSPITKAEALKLTRSLSTMLPGQEREVITDIAGRFQEMFGDNADTAFSFALRAHKVDRETAQTAARMIKKLGLGQSPTADDMRGADQKTEIGAAEQAVQGVPAQRRGTNPGRIMAREAANPSPMPAQPAAEQQQPTAQPAKDTARVPPATDIMALRKNPALAPRFEQKYGKGSAKKILDAYPAGAGR